MRAALVAAVKRCIPASVIRYRGPASRPYVALTFDDGPIPELTPRVLEALRDRGHQATFFLIGAEAERHPGLVRHILDAGCEVGNHTQAHSRMRHLPPSDVPGQIEQADAAIRAAGGSPPAYFRPPRGEITPALLRYLRRSRRPSPVLWSRMVVREESRTAAEIETDFRTRPPRPGDIILLHDDYPETVRALPGILRVLEDEGLRSVTLSELLQR